jgi:amino acid transporter
MDKRPTSPPGARSAPAHEDLNSEDAILQAQGVTPILARRMGFRAAVTGPFNIISVPTGLIATLGLGMNSGGPAGMWWAWLGVSAATMVVGMVLGEMASAMPTAAALYQWTHQLAKPARSRRDSHRVGWLNFFGLAGGVASVCYASAVSLQFLIAMQWPSYTATPDRTLLITGVVLVFSGLVNTLTIGAVSKVNQAAAWWIIGGILFFVVVLVAVPHHHQSLSWVFTHTVNQTGLTGHWWAGSFGIVLAGGCALYTYCGYDMAAHTAEETLGASRTVPAAITRAIFVSAVCGAIMIAALMYAVQDYAKESGSGSPAAQLFQDALGSSWAKVALAVALVIQLFCSVAVTTAASRQWYAFSGRNDAMVGAKWWRYVSPNWKVPVGSVWFSVAFGGLLCLPGLWNGTVLNAVVSINFVGLLTAYMVPIYLRLRRPERFVQGPWRRRHSLLYAKIALVWTVVGTLIGISPQTFPITRDDFNYAGPALLAVLVLEQILWLWRGRAYQPPAPMSAAEAAELADDLAG